jgi:uroporphyrinogen-III synthase
MDKSVLLIRSAGNEEDAAALAKVNISSIIDPYLSITCAQDTEPAEILLEKISTLPSPVWLVATSINAIERWAEIVTIERMRNAIYNRKDLNFAAIGEKTASVLEKYGAKNVLLPKQANVEALIESLNLKEKANIILPSGNIAMKNLPSFLAKNGWTVHREVVYQTDIVVSQPKSSKMIEDDQIAAVIFRSPSSVRAFFQFNKGVVLPFICAGETTASELRNLGITCDRVSEDPTPTSVAKAVQQVLEVN